MLLFVDYSVFGYIIINECSKSENLLAQTADGGVAFNAGFKQNDQSFECCHPNVQL